jgi:hypothetical protein
MLGDFIGFVGLYFDKYVVGLSIPNFVIDVIFSF